MRFHSEFGSTETIKVLARHRVRQTMAVRANTPAVAKMIAPIDEDAWTEIDYTPGGQAQVAETAYNGRRLILRRTRLVDQHRRDCGRTGSTPLSESPGFRDCSI